MLEVRLKEYGLESIEVADDGYGIDSVDYALLGRCRGCLFLFPYHLLHRTQISHLKIVEFRGPGLGMLVWFSWRGFKFPLFSLKCQHSYATEGSVRWD